MMCSWVTVQTLTEDDDDDVTAQPLSEDDDDVGRSQARVAEAAQELACSVESYTRWLALVSQSGTVLLPSCVFGNSISVGVVDKCSRDPSAELESQILDARLEEL
eukprot:2913548-Rhodomonas_salina.1